MNVFIIPEDFRKDEQVLTPIIEALMAYIGKPRAHVTVCKDPLLGGVSQALDQVRLEEIVDRYKGMVDIFLLLVDRDDEPGRRVRLDQLEGLLSKQLPPNRHFLGENAWQEVEVWLIAGHNLLPDWNWETIRAERDPKEAYFVPLAKSRDLIEEPDEGRGALAQEAAHRYKRIRKRCPELVALEAAIRGKVG
jgi:hypothetical protein